MNNFFAIIICLLSLILSLIEGANYLDTHHDPIIFSNSLFIMNGLLPYKDFYVQYGIIQPTINAIFFKLFGARFILQNFVVAATYSIFLYFNYKIIRELINKNSALLFLLILFFLEPFVILPWPNFFIGLIAAIGLYYFVLYIKYKNSNYFYITLFLISLLPLTRLNAGIIIVPIFIVAGLVITYKSRIALNYLKLVISVSPLFLIVYLLNDSDFIKQALILPSQYILPLYFKIPNDLLYIAALHIQLFFIEPNLFSVVSASEILFLWRYIVILGIFIGAGYFIYSIISRKLFSDNNKIIFIFAACAGSMSSSVFPIFDSFRAINAWFPFLIIIYFLAYNYLSNRKFYTIFTVIPVLLIYINVTTKSVSIPVLVNLFKFENMKVQLIDFSEPFHVVSRDQYDNTANEPQALKLNSQQRLPLDQYIKLKNILNTRCNDKKFISTSEDFFIYLLLPNMHDKLAHKMYYYQTFKTRKGIPVDANLELYPDFKNILNNHKNLCYIYHHRKPQMLLDDLIEFDEEIILGDISILIR
jgi:hypothetical protein